MEERKITMGSLFDGSGGFPLAGAMSGIESKWASEIEEYPIKLTSKRFPNMKHLGDICEINGTLIEPVDIITGGSPCFIGSTLVKTNRGLIPIMCVKEGDYVLTHKGRMKKVIETMSRGSKNIYEMKVFGTPVLYTTNNHPFYTMNINEMTTSWKTTEKLETGDYIAVPLNSEQKINNSLNLNEDECWFLGQFFSKGKTNGYVGFSIDSELYDRYKYKINTLTGIVIRKSYNECDENEFLVVVTEESNKLFDLCYEIKRCKSNFDLPKFVFELPDNLVAEFLSGVIGVSVEKLKNSSDTKQFMASLDIKLIVQFQSLMMRLFGKIYKCNYEKHSERNSVKFFNDMFWVRFEYSKKIDIITKVYNLEVEEDHSYTVNGLAAHNCQDMSLAGNRKGMKLICHNCKSEFDIDSNVSVCDKCGSSLEKTRSGLFIEQIRLIKEMRREQELRGIPRESIKPRYFVWENVAGAFSSNKGEDFRQVLNGIVSVVEDKFDVPRHETNKWGKSGVIMGDRWSIAWRQFNAQYWGVPQRRRRIYLVADFGGLSAPEILFESKGLSGDNQESRITWKEITRNFGKRIDECDKQAEHENLNIPNLKVYEIYHNMKKCNVSFDADYWQKENTNGKAYGFDGWKSQASDICFNENVSPCLCTAGIANVLVDKKCFGISSLHSNAMLSGNPNSGISETKVARTLDLNGGNPTCNQGGVVVVEPAYCLQGSMIGRKEGNGPNGSGINEEVAFTLNTVDKHAVNIRENCVRRFTPLECCRLQGFPDWWCDDVKHCMTSEYKMWGNGIALPNAYFVMSRIAKFLTSSQE